MKRNTEFHVETSSEPQHGSQKLVFDLKVGSDLEQYFIAIGDELREEYTFDPEEDESL